MGAEYRFKITPEQKADLVRTINGINSLDFLFRSAPHFIGEKEGIYSYSDDPQNPERWPSNIGLEEGGFVLAVYGYAADTELLTYLVMQLLYLCGGVNVEDA